MENNTNNLEVVVISMDRIGYNQGSTIRAIRSIESVSVKMGDWFIATVDNTADKDYQEYRVLVIDRGAEIKAGMLALCSDGAIREMLTDCIDNFLTKKYKAIISAYPPIPNIPPIHASVIQQLVDSGMRAKVVGEMVMDYCESDVDNEINNCVGCSGNGKGDCNATMRRKYHPTGELCLKVVSEPYTPENCYARDEEAFCNSVVSEQVDDKPIKIENMKTGIELIAQERQEQIEKHGRTVEADVALNSSGQLATAAEMLLAADHEEGIDPECFPEGWSRDICNAMLNKPYKERLVIAGALIAAEIDRIANL